MSAIAPANSTVAQIRTKVRRLTATASQSALPDQQIDEAINTFYSQDFPYAIKTDQLRDVYSFFTIPNIDRYPLDVNSYQGIRAPVYFQGRQGYFSKDRDQFYKFWYRPPFEQVVAQGDGVTNLFTFTLTGPFLATLVTVGGVDSTGAPIRITDEGGQGTTQGNLLYITTNSVGNAVPPTPPTSPIPSGIPSNTVGQVNYVTGAFSINFPVAPAAGSNITVFVTKYTAGGPDSLLFWNNEFVVRPVPDRVIKIEVESYMSPVQFLLSNENPRVNQWWQYVAFGSALEILRDRQDMEGIENLMEGFKRQEALVLERQTIEEIGQRNGTIFTQPPTGFYNGWPYGNY